MKWSLVFICLLVFVIKSIGQQEILILKVSPEGSKFTLNGKTIEPGSTIYYTSTDRIIYPNKYSYVWAYLKNSRQYLTLCFNCTQIKATSETGGKLSYLIEAVLPKAVPTELGAKTGSKILDLAALQRTLSGNESYPLRDTTRFNTKSYVILDYASFIIDTNVMKLDTGHYLFCRKQLKNDAGYDDLLIESKDNKVIIWKDLFEKYNNPIDSDSLQTYKIYFYDGENDYLISDFRPVFPDTSSLRKEVMRVHENNKELTIDDRLILMKDYINHFYGAISAGDFRRWWITALQK